MVKLMTSSFGLVGVPLSSQIPDESTAVIVQSEEHGVNGP